MSDPKGGEVDVEHGNSAGVSADDLAASAAKSRAIKSAKQARTTSKGLFTRALTKMGESLLENDEEDIHTSKEELKLAFRNYQDSSEAYKVLLDDERSIEDSESHYDEVHGKYMDMIGKIKQTLEHNSSLNASATQATLNTSLLDDPENTSALSMLHLAKVEIEPFSGNPKDYHPFVKSFDCNIGEVTKNPDLKLTRLNQYCTGPAKSAIRSAVLIGGEKGYLRAREILKSRFGSKDIVTERYINDLKSGEPLRSNSDYRVLADDLINAYLVLKELGTLARIDSQENMKQIASRLPTSLYERFRRKLFDAKRRDLMHEYPGFKFLVDFVQELSDDNNDPTWGYEKPSQKSKNPKPRNNTSNFAKSDNSSDKLHRANAGNSTERSSVPVINNAKSMETGCILCSSKHRLWNCKQFKKLTVSDRLSLIKINNLCQNCFRSHDISECDSKNVCLVPGCGLKHSMYLHCDELLYPASTANQVKTNTADYSMNGNVYMPIKEVCINGLKVYAIDDTCSSQTYIIKSVFDKLPCKVSRTETSELRTLHGTRISTYECANISVTSTDGTFTLDMENVHIIDGPIPVEMSHVDLEAYPHLRKLHLPAYNVKNIEIGLLIGQDNSEAFRPLSIRKGDKNQPYAVNTVFGWTVHGRTAKLKPVYQGKHAVSNLISSKRTPDISCLWEMENVGIVDPALGLAYSQDDRNVLKLWDSDSKIVDGRFEIPPPWKDKHEKIPDNFFIAKKCLEGLFRRFQKDGRYEKYRIEIQKLLDNDFAEQITSPDEINRSDGRVNYLPHHGVVKENKPGKLRVCFNCASKHKGKCLNDRCYQGPDLLNRLLDVFLRFCQHDIGIQADISAMYNQIALPKEDWDCFRFLWFDENGDLMHCRMKRHLFGAIFCSASSTYALRRTISDFDDVPEVVQRAVKEEFYVDDLLSSKTKCNGKSDAKTLITKLPQILARRKFPLGRMITSDSELNSMISEDSRLPDYIDLTPECTGKALGIKWRIGSDEFYYEFSFTIPDFLTRRITLSDLNSIYDPPGWLGCYLLSGKLIFQEATRRKLDWDQQLPTDLYQSWIQFVESLKNMSDLRIPRCMKPGQYDDAEITLHYFSDASLIAYGCMCYLHCRLPNGDVHTRLVMTKHKVAPMKAVTIVRLELQAATLSAKLSNYLKDTLTLDVKASYFWTDSEIVLKYIMNESKRFNVFVANRVSLIHESSDVKHWQHIAGTENPADLLTRVNTRDSVDVNRWLYGPDILKSFDHSSHQSKSMKMNIDYELDEHDPEIRKQALSYTSVKSISSAFDMLLARHSSWMDLKRAIAWYYRLLLYFRKDRKAGALTASEIRHAGKRLVLAAQQRHFSEDVAALKKNGVVSKSSRLLTLSPYLDADGLMRVGGRLKHANMIEKNPYIIPSSHHIATCMVNDAHGVAHVGVGWTACELLSLGIHLFRGRPLIKRLISKCITCRRLFAKPCKQIMAALPPPRVDVGGGPFKKIGCDVFGPFYVKVNRSTVKRYGLLVTCLSSRAVTIELLYQMDTSACINALRRFIARRGPPEVIFSDNGTNFLGADRELKEALKELKNDRLLGYLAAEDIEWEFIPPAASHWAGAWERLVGVVKKVMKGTLPQGMKLTDDTLLTLFAEAEYIVNTRPLTKVNDDPTDMTPLTPKDLLMVSSYPKPMGKFDQDDLYRSSWRHVQHLAEQFWRKFVKAYLPTLQKRVKWTDVQRNLKERDLVLLTPSDALIPRYQWPLAIVEAVLPSRDGHVRAVEIKTISGSKLTRPITKLILLEGKDDKLI